MSDSGNIKVSQVRGNFNRIARDLDRALSVAGFNATEAFLIARARELSWPHHAADGDPEPFSINLSEAARLLGRDRKWISIYHKGLVDSRVFKATDGGRYLINKDYREWVTTEGARRLDDMQIAWCMEVRKGGRSTPKSADRGMAKMPHPPVADMPHPPMAKMPQGAGVQYGENATGGMAFMPQGGVADMPQSGDPPLTSPPEIQRFQREKREKSDVGRPHADAITPAHAGTPADARTREAPPEPATQPSAPAYPSDPALAPEMINPGRQPEDPAWAAEFWGRLWAAFGSSRVLWDFYRHQRWYPRECWEAALAKCVRQGTRVESGAYLERIAASYEAHGIPAEGPAKPRPTARQEKTARISAFLTGKPKGGV